MLSSIAISIALREPELTSTGITDSFRPRARIDRAANPLSEMKGGFCFWMEQWL